MLDFGVNEIGGSSLIESAILCASLGKSVGQRSQPQYQG